MGEASDGRQQIDRWQRQRLLPAEDVDVERLWAV